MPARSTPGWTFIGVCSVTYVYPECAGIFMPLSPVALGMHTGGTPHLYSDQDTPNQDFPTPPLGNKRPLPKSDKSRTQWAGPGVEITKFLLVYSKPFIPLHSVARQYNYIGISKPFLELDTQETKFPALSFGQVPKKNLHVRRLDFSTCPLENNVLLITQILGLPQPFLLIRDKGITYDFHPCGEVPSLGYLYLHVIWKSPWSWICQCFFTMAWILPCSSPPKLIRSDIKSSGKFAISRRLKIDPETPPLPLYLVQFYRSREHGISFPCITSHLTWTIENHCSRLYVTLNIF